MKRGWMVILFVLWLVVACGSQETAEPEDVTAQVAKAWITAVLHQDGETINKLSCASFESVQPSSVVIALWGIGLAAKNVDVDPNTLDIDLDFQTTKTALSSAEVHVTGHVVVLPKLRENVLDIRIPLNDEFEVEDTWNMVQEMDGWKWCGTVAPLGEE